MSRSGYKDYDDDGAYPLALYRGAVRSSIRGKRGQALMKDLASAMDAMPIKRLIAGELTHDGESCALGVVGHARKVDLSKVDPYDAETIAGKLDVADCLAREVAYENDEHWPPETPEQRWTRMRAWVGRMINSEEKP